MSVRLMIQWRNPSNCQYPILDRAMNALLGDRVAAQQIIALLPAFGFYSNWKGGMPNDYSIGYIPFNGRQRC